MPRGRNITPAGRREWLEEYDRGRTYAEIAHKADRDTRTIKAHIEKAAQEQEARLARRDQIRGALDKHNEELVEVARGIRDNLRVLADERLTPIAAFPGFAAFPTSNPLTFPVGRYMVDRDKLAVVVTAGDTRPAKLEGLLREHLRSEAVLWRDVGDWCDSYVEYITRCLRLGGDVATRLTEITQLEPIEEGGTTGFRELMVSWACRLAIEAAGSQGTRPDPELAIAAGQLRYGGSTLARSDSDDQLERARQAFIDVLEDIRLSSGVQKIARLKKDLNAKGESIRDRLEDILLFEFISGKCRVCRKHAV